VRKQAESNLYTHSKFGRSVFYLGVCEQPRYETKALCFECLQAKDLLVAPTERMAAFYILPAVIVQILITMHYNIFYTQKAETCCNASFGP